MADLVLDELVNEARRIEKINTELYNSRKRSMTTEPREKETRLWNNNNVGQPGFRYTPPSPPPSRDLNNNNNRFRNGANNRMQFSKNQNNSARNATVELGADCSLW